MERQRAPHNRTLTLTQAEREYYGARLLQLNGPVCLSHIENRTICQDMSVLLPWLPERFVDLLILDPPYNLTKTYQAHTFQETSPQEYLAWFESWFVPLLRVLTPTASVYICGDWRSSTILYGLISRWLHIRNRITWEREKGRGAKANWKNCSEDIWFCTVSEDYVFNLDAVKLKRRVLAPYRTGNGSPKDWQEETEGDYRQTAPSNLWTDLTVPFWSMPENTDHPTQKPEKLLAKLVLASSLPGAVVFDPFLGSGTTSVVAKKLGRRYVGVEREREYCCLTEKRLERAETDSSIQGYQEGIFWERNSFPRSSTMEPCSHPASALSLFHEPIERYRTFPPDTATMGEQT